MSGSIKKKVSTANISEDVRAKFPLHSAVWENDYRNLEELIRSLQVGTTMKTLPPKYMSPKQCLLAG